MAATGADDADPIRFRDLLGGNAQVTATVFDDLALSDRAPDDRPYLVVNMIATLDGRAAHDGRTAKLGNEGDRALFHRLRAQGDAVMVGAGTVRAERYGPLVRDEALRELRAARGMDDPFAVIVTASLRLDATIPLLADPASRIVVLTSAPEVLEGGAAQIEYLRHEGSGDLRLRPLLERLRRDYGVRSIVCEGGPTLNDALLREDLVDELFLSIAPVVLGGPDPLTIVSGAGFPEPARFELAGLLELDSHLFTRYRRRHAA